MYTYKPFRNTTTVLWPLIFWSQPVFFDTTSNSVFHIYSISFHTRQPEFCMFTPPTYPCTSPSHFHFRLLSPQAPSSGTFLFFLSNYSFLISPLSQSPTTSAQCQGTETAPKNNKRSSKCEEDRVTSLLLF